MQSISQDKQVATKIMDITYSDLYKSHPQLPYFFDNLSANRNIDVQKSVLDELARTRLSSNVEYLSVGCGDGKVTFDIIQYLSSLGKKINIHYVDPAKWQFDKLKSSQLFEPKSVYLDVFENLTLDMQFDIIESIHSWYGMAGNYKYLNKLVSLLKPNGIGIIVMVAKAKSLSYKIKCKFRELDIPFIPINFYEDLQDDAQKTLVTCNVRIKEDMTQFTYPPLIENDDLTLLAESIIYFYSYGNADLTNRYLKNIFISFFKEMETPVQNIGSMIICKRP